MSKRISRRQARERQLADRARQTRARLLERKPTLPSNMSIITGSFGGDGGHFDDGCPICVAMRDGGFESTVIDGTTVTRVPDGLTLDDLARMGFITNLD